MPIITSDRTVRTATKLSFAAIVAMFSPAEGNNASHVQQRFIKHYCLDRNATVCLTFQIDGPWEIHSYLSFGSAIVYSDPEQPSNLFAYLLMETELELLRVEYPGVYVITAVREQDGSWTLEYQMTFEGSDRIAARNMDAQFHRAAGLVRNDSVSVV